MFMLKVALSKKNDTIAVGENGRKLLEGIKKRFKEKNGFEIGDKNALETVATRIIENHGTPIDIFPDVNWVDY